MSSTPVYIICSPRPQVGKTLIARLLSEFLLLKNGRAQAFDINLKEPSLLDYLPRITETADVIDNEFVVRGELPPVMTASRVLRFRALPVFLKTYIDRLTFSFTGYLRQERDSSTELHQWIRRNYTTFRDLELSMLLQRG